MKVTTRLTLAVASVLAMGAINVASAAKDTPAVVGAVGAKQVQVVINGQARWLPVPASSETDQLGRISKAVFEGREYEVLATKHTIDGRSIIVERVSFEADKSQSIIQPAFVESSPQRKVARRG